MQLQNDLYVHRVHIQNEIPNKQGQHLQTDKLLLYAKDNSLLIIWQSSTIVATTNTGIFYKKTMHTG